MIVERRAAIGEDEIKRIIADKYRVDEEKVSIEDIRDDWYDGIRAYIDLGRKNVSDIKEACKI